MVYFREKTTARELACINVHLASKRHQHSIFAPEKPGFDARLPIRVRQAEIIEEQLAVMRGAAVWIITSQVISMIPRRARRWRRSSVTKM